MNETKIIPTNLKVINKKINSFTINKTQHAINQNIELIKQICHNMELGYQGQSLGTLIGKIIEETIQILPKSNHYPAVFKHILKSKEG
jgi:hypothetical protein